MSEIDHRMFKALSHSLRVEILRQLEEGPSSPNRISERLGEEVSNVSHHMKVLLECECVELIDTRPVRGTVERVYKLKPQGAIGSASWKEVPSVLRTKYANNALATFAERAIEALDAGTLESREGSGVTWLPLTVDEPGWKELRRVLRNCEMRSRAVADKSAERMDGPEDGIAGVIAVAALELPGGKDVDPS